MNALWMSGRRRSGYLAGAVAVVGLLILLSTPDAQWLQAAGRPTPGHEGLACEACHVPAPGTFRQQVQAGVRYLLGMRGSPVAIGKAPVEDARCEACHERPGDRHPLAVLSGTQFVGAQAEHGVHHCTGCHREHHGARVTAPPTICSECHRDIEVKDDPIQPSHATLFAADRWETCLQCHDFHGNHDLSSGPYDCAAEMEEAFDVAAVRRYLLDGPRVYGDPVTPAKEGK